VGEVNAVNDMNTVIPNMVGRGSRITELTRGADGPLRPINLATPLRLPSRSQRFASIETFAWHTANHGSARFSAQNIPRSHTVKTPRTPAVIREPRPTTYDLQRPNF
jgi:hypothetical protein